MTWTMRLIIFFIIYIPIIFLIFKRVEKNVERAILIILVVISMPIAYGISTAIVPYYYLAPFEGKVIDADTKAPIVGAAVLAVYHKEIPSIGMGSNSYAIDAQETLTDEKGEFRIPEFKKWFGDKKGEPDGNITIFKPGYGVFPDYERAIAVGVSDTWPPPEKYIVYELPKLKTMEEREKNVIYIRRYNEIPYSKRKNYWKTINEERSNLGLPLNTMTEKERER